MGSDGSDRQTGGQRSIVPLPFVRKLRLHMDSCPSTNKSQFFFGGLGLLISCGVLDCVQVLFMVVGQTKFGPDAVAQKIATSFNRSDVFNHGQLLNLMRAYLTAGAYDGETLQTWKEATQQLFCPIAHIMSYRSFVLLADDGAVDLGEPPSHGADVPSFPDPGRLVEDAMLMRECDGAARRSLRDSVLPALRQRTYRGIGQAAVPDRSNAATGARLLPNSSLTCRSVRLSTRRSTVDKYWREQQGWMEPPTMAKINNALSAVTPYTAHPDLSKLPYGAKAKALTNQYEKFLPRRYVPEKYSVASAGYSGRAGATSTQEETRVRGDDGVAETTGSKNAATLATIDPHAAVPKKMRWAARLHKDKLLSLLLAPPHNGKPTPGAHWHQRCRRSAAMFGTRAPF